MLLRLRTDEGLTTFSIAGVHYSAIDHPVSRLQFFFLHRIAGETNLHALLRRPRASSQTSLRPSRLFSLFTPSMDLLRSRKRATHAHISLPLSDDEEEKPQRRSQHRSSLLLLSSASLFLASFLLLGVALATLAPWPFPPAPPTIPSHIAAGLESCKANKFVPGPPVGFAERITSDRFVEGTKRVIIKNARLWTGNEGGKEVVENATLVLDGGIIAYVGDGEGYELNRGEEGEVVDAKGMWVTPGVVSRISSSAVGDSS